MTDGKGKRWVVPVSHTAKNTFNSIRNVVDTMKIVPNPDLELIKVTVGDPTIYGNLPASERCVEAFCEAVRSGKANGYFLAHGSKAAREAVAKYCSTPEITISSEDVILSSGCSGAVEFAIDVLADPGDNIITPRPGFDLYRCVSGSRGIETRCYNLIHSLTLLSYFECLTDEVNDLRRHPEIIKNAMEDIRRRAALCVERNGDMSKGTAHELPEKSWEADLDHIESLIDDRTRLIMVINPSNPCGSVYTKQHLEAILAVAEKHQIPIVSDEVYAFCTFGERPFYSMGTLSKNVPVITVGGIAKRFLVPGWRMGWVVLHNRNGAFGDEIKAGLRRLAQRILGPCAPLQAALPTILSECKPEFFEKTRTVMKRNSNIFYDNFSRVPELYPVRSYGAMYMLVGINIDQLEGIKDDVDFTERLMTEQSVFCLPATCFAYPNFFRVVLTCIEDKTIEACERIATFCKNHRKQSASNDLTNGIIHTVQNGC